MMTPPRRVVTGHDSSGRAIVLSDAPPPRVLTNAAQPGLAFHEIWNTRTTPAPISAQEDEPTWLHDGTAPPRNGTVIRIVDIPPEGDGAPDLDSDAASAVLASVGLDAPGAKPHGRHPLMHRTRSIDYGIVLEGEIVLMLDDDDVVLRAGDIVVQRGTIHAWNNRSDAICRIAFILVDGVFDPALSSSLDL